MYFVRPSITTSRPEESRIIIGDGLLVLVRGLFLIVCSVLVASTAANARESEAQIGSDIPKQQRKMVFEAGDDLPPRLYGVGVEEHLGETIPLDVEFSDHDGRKVSFASLLEGGKPVILTLNYSNCPGLCIAQLNGLVRGINDVGSLKLGTDFQMVSVSIDPTDSIKKAAETKARYAGDLESQHSAKGWHFWTGSEKNIQKLAKAVGFLYTYDAKNNQFNHPATAIFVSPKGRMTRYLYEVGYVGETLKMALIEAGEGRIGSPLDAFMLWCSHYDADENRYSASARTLLSVCAGVFVTMGLVALIPFWLSGRQSRKGLDSNLEVTSANASGETFGHATS